jgi:hypothetical protein
MVFCFIFGCCTCPLHQDQRATQRWGPHWEGALRQAAAERSCGTVSHVLAVHCHCAVAVAVCQPRMLLVVPYLSLI